MNVWLKVQLSFSSFFLSLFSPPNSSKETTRKKCHSGNVFVSEPTNTGHGGSANTAFHDHGSANTTSRNTIVRRKIRHNINIA